MYNYTKDLYYKKLEEITKNNKDEIASLEENILNKYLLKLEKKLLKDLYSKEFIPTKLYVQFNEEIDNKCKKWIEKNNIKEVNKW